MGLLVWLGRAGRDRTSRGRTRIHNSAARPAQWRVFRQNSGCKAEDLTFASDNTGYRKGGAGRLNSGSRSGARWNDQLGRVCREGGGIRLEIGPPTARAHGAIPHCLRPLRSCQKENLSVMLSWYTSLVSCMAQMATHESVAPVRPLSCCSPPHPTSWAITQPRHLIASGSRLADHFTD